MTIILVTPAHCTHRLHNQPSTLTWTTQQTRHSCRLLEMTTEHGNSTINGSKADQPPQDSNCTVQSPSWTAQLVGTRIRRVYPPLVHRTTRTIGSSLFDEQAYCTEILILALYWITTWLTATLVTAWNDTMRQQKTPEGPTKTIKIQPLTASSLRNKVS